MRARPRPIAEVHRQLSQLVAEDRLLPGTVCLGHELERPLARVHCPERVPGVLPRIAEPLAGGERGAPIRILRELLERLAERARVGPFEREDDSHHPG